MKYLPHIGFVIFLIAYSIFKYQAVPQLMGQPAYIKSTVILVFLTAILPFFISYFIAGRLLGKKRLLAAFGLPLVFCGLGLAAFFYIYIKPNAPLMSIAQILPRAIIPGVIMGLLLGGSTLMHRKN